ncbi:MAG: haloacid dehalogenase type II [Dehalococcoidia bacterium]|nr:haloacid dehalogenase type II [Dehalococcoidia bacterium]
MKEPPLRALLFDVFGTVVDWRSGVAREGEALASRLGLPRTDWGQVADRWRALYQPAMEEVRSGRRPFVPLDTLHRENLEAVLAEFGIKDLPAAEVDEFSRAWHRLDPWPDSVEGLTRLKARYIVAPQSNGNIALIVNMAKRAGLPWDCVLGAEVTGHYKPDPECYREACRLLGLRGEECMMVAAHQGDLIAARDAAGVRTAFIPRPLEYGPGAARDLTPRAEFDVVADSLVALAERLGC